eukprot:IDg7260t1
MTAPSCTAMPVAQVDDIPVLSMQPPLTLMDLLATDCDFEIASTRVRTKSSRETDRVWTVLATLLVQELRQVCKEYNVIQQGKRRVNAANRTPTVVQNRVERGCGGCRQSDKGCARLKNTHHQQSRSGRGFQRGPRQADRSVMTIPA